MNKDTGVNHTSLRFDEPLDVEDVPEFHAARILILMRICGEGNSSILRGRTKLAKLDFFVRYPHFLEAALKKLAEQGQSVPNYVAGEEGVEASMIRYKYGPWDNKYYNLLALLDARGLLRIGGGNIETYSLTINGQAAADNLMGEEAFRVIVERCKIVLSTLASFNGTALKEFVYETFIDEIVNLPKGRIISDVAKDRTY